MTQAVTSRSATSRPWGLTLFIVVMLALVWLRPMDELADRYTDSGWKRALITFGSARLINAGLSFAQELEITGAPLGVGGSMHPGAFLQPLDELVEQFSTLMLGATLSFAVQRLLLQLTSAWPLCLALSVLLVSWLAWRWRRPQAPGLLVGAAVAMLCARLVVPLCAIGSEATYHWLLAGEYEQAQAEIASFKGPEVQAAGGARTGWMERARDMLSRAPELAKQFNLDQLKAEVNSKVEHLIRLLAVFLVQTLVFPLMFWWGAWRIARLLMGMNSRLRLPLQPGGA